MENVGILTAFAFGLLSFASPCVLPIVPGYLSYISGISFEEIQNSSSQSILRKRIIINCIFFIAGFSLVFIGFGASATVLGQFFQQQLNLLSKIAGVIIIVFGLHMTGMFRIPFLNYEKRFHTSSKPLGLLGAFVIGLAFAFGWTPCIGPILAAILAIASQQETVGQGIVLLSSYSLGLGIPFLLTGLSMTVFFNVFNKLKKHLHKIEVASGIMLIAVGILIITNYLTILSAYLSKWFPFLNELG
ncbi:MAG: cytochrome c biogenesis protein CcdA [Ignavibacteriae bacterium]|nr:cytochrome c biogenesis protein CcdA [Ignavibacteriota bacterium]